MSLFGSLMGDVEDDPFFGSHMRHMRQMNNMMNSLFSDPFGMMGGPMSLMPRSGGMGGVGGMAMMPFMPQMPQMNRLFSADLMGMDGPMSAGSSFSSSTVVMSSGGPNGKPQVYSSTSSTKIGPNGVKETRKTLQDSRTGTKKMSIGHHIGERAHLVEREQNVYSGDQEERQEFINLEEEEAEDFDREFQVKSGGYNNRAALTAARAPPARLAIEAAPAHAHQQHSQHEPNSYSTSTKPSTHGTTDTSASNGTLASPASRASSCTNSGVRPLPRRPLRAAATASPLAHGANSSSVRSVYGGSHPQRHRHRAHNAHKRHATDH